MDQLWFHSHHHGISLETAYNAGARVQLPSTGINDTIAPFVLNVFPAGEIVDYQHDLDSPLFPLFNAVSEVPAPTGQSYRSENAHARNGQPTPPPEKAYVLPQVKIPRAPSGCNNADNAMSSVAQQINSDSNFTQATSEYPTTGPYKRQSRSIVNQKNDDTDHQGKKRQRILARNRLAASKCRDKKKKMAQELESRHKQQAARNEQLKIQVRNLKNEALGLSDLFLTHAKYCDHDAITRHVHAMTCRIHFKDISPCTVLDETPVIGLCLPLQPSTIPDDLLKHNSPNMTRVETPYGSASPPSSELSSAEDAPAQSNINDLFAEV